MLAIASRPGTCQLCRLPIVSGELIRPDDLRDAWVHARCHDAARPGRHRRRPTTARPRVDAVDRGPRSGGETGRRRTD